MHGGLDVLQRNWKIWRANHASRSTIDAYQQQRLARLVQFARTRSPYYRKHYAQVPIGCSQLHRLPTVTKKDLMNNFDEWSTDPAVTYAGVTAFRADRARIGQLYQGRYLLTSTSGTSGEPAIILHDRQALAIYDTLQLLRGWPRWLTPHLFSLLIRQGWRMASIIATGGHYAGVANWERQRWKYPFLSGQIRSFSALLPLPEIIRQMNAYRPAVLSAYASVLLLLAQARATGALTIRPRLIFSAGETLTAGMRAQIRQAFACPVYDVYGATEFLYIAYECRYGRLHLNADWVLLEPVDAAYRPVEPGTPPYTVLLTNLANRIQPIIRYDLGDRVTFGSGACPCGSTLPAIMLEGRSSETMIFPSSTGKAVPVLSLPLITVAEETPGVFRCQLLQAGPTRLRVRYEVTPGADPQMTWQVLATNLHKYLAGRGAAAVSIEHDPEVPSANPVSGKFQQVITYHPATNSV